MALASIIFSANKRTEFLAPGLGKAVLTIDATLRASHSAGAQITKKELEKGTQVNDHMTTAPESVVIEGVISETPLDIFSSLAGTSIGAAASLASQSQGLGAAAVTGLIGGGIMSKISGSRTSDAFKIMVDLQKNRTLFDLVTGLKRYSNMMLTSITANRSTQIGQAIQFTAVIEQITFVTSQIINLSEGDMLGNAGNGAASETNLGKQSLKSVSEETSSNGSILFNLVGGFF